MPGLSDLREVKQVKEVKTSRASRRRAACLWALFTSLTLFTSLSSVPRAQQVPSFRARIEVVQLDVSVLDKNRQPVRGLTEKDFTILEDGKPQRIVGFSAFDIDAAPAPAVGWMRDVPQDVTTNELKESRLFVLVMDDGMIPQDPAMIRDSKKVAMSIIDKLGPDDLTAVVFTGDNRKTQDFTNDKTKLRAALDKFNPGLAGYRFGLDTYGSVDIDLWFYQSSIRTLSNIAEYLIAVPGRRKAVFWVSPGVPVDMANCRPVDTRVVNPAAPATCTEKLNLPPAHVVELLQRTEEVFRRAQRSNVTIYPVDPAGLGGLRFYLSTRLGPFNELVAAHKATMQQDFLAQAAANTGGRTVMNTNDFEPGITDIFAENSSYYLVGFEPANTKPDGTLRRIQVKVNRPDVEVRTRSNYYAPEPEKPADKKNAKTAMTPEAAELAKAIGGILPSTAVPLKVAVAAFAVPGQRLSTVSVVLGVRQPVPAAAAKDRITETTELQTSAFTPEGDPRGTQRHTAKVVLRAGADGEAAYEVLGRIDLPAGRYRLRLAAVSSATGKSGAVFTDVIVPDYSNVPFSASPIVLSASPGRVSAPRDLFAKLLPLVPTAERAFGAGDRVTAFLRLYQSGQKPIEPVQVTIRVRDAQDQVNVTTTQTIGADQFPTTVEQAPAAALAPGQIRPPVFAGRGATPTSQTGDQFANTALRAANVTFQVPFSKLSPGPHLLTFEATLGTTVQRRDVRFEVR